MAMEIDLQGENGIINVSQTEDVPVGIIVFGTRLLQMLDPLNREELTML